MLDPQRYRYETDKSVIHCQNYPVVLSVTERECFNEQNPPMVPDPQSSQMPN